MTINICVLPNAGYPLASFKPEAEIFIKLATNGFNITMMMDTKLEFATMLSAAGIKLVPFRTTKKVDLKAIRLIRKTIEENAIDIVYATYSRFISNAAFACIGKPVRMIAYRGTTGGLYRYDPSRYLGVLHPRVDGVICVSNAVQQHVHQYASARLKPHVKTIYKGHDLAWYNSPPADLQQFAIPRESFTIACIASERPHKGLIYLLQAARRLADKESIHLVLIGHAPRQTELVDAIDQSGMAERIHLTGYREDAAQIMAACDVLAFPSYRKEGLPRTLLESLAGGTPAVTANIPCSAEVISDNFNGLLVPCQDANSLADKLLYLFENREELARLSSNCQQIFADKMSHRATVDAYAAYFRSMM